MRALSEPTMSGYLRRLVVIFLPVPLSVFLALAVALDGRWSAPGWTILLGGCVAVAALLLAVLIQPSPLPEGLSVNASVRRSLHRYRKVTQLRIVLAMAAVAGGAGAAVAGGGLLPYIAAALLAWPQLLLALPGYNMITAARRGMESWGARAYLWAALAMPAPAIRPMPQRLAGDRAAGAGEIGDPAGAPEAETGQGTRVAVLSSRGATIVRSLGGGTARAITRGSRPLLRPRPTGGPATKDRGSSGRTRPRTKN